MKNKILILVVFGLLLVGLSIYAARVVFNQGKSTEQLADFAIADTAAVDKIKISDSFGGAIELVRKGGQWETADGKCVQQDPVHNILHTFINIGVQSYLPEKAVNNIRNQISINYRKVEIFQHGTWVKTWYVGNSTSNHYGTYAVLETAEDGKSEAPVILEMRGLKGTIEPRFFTDYRQWQCTQIYSSSSENITSVKLQHYETPSLSFVVEQKGKQQFALKINGKEVTDFDKVKADEYFHRFQNVHFNMPNYWLNPKQIDSLKQTKPFYKLTVNDKKQGVISVSTYKIALAEPETDMLGDTSYYDLNSLWGILDDGSLVRVQYFVFDKIAVPPSFFLFPKGK